MTKIKNKFWILLISAILLSAVFFTVGKIAYADDTKECAHEYARETIEPIYGIYLYALRGKLQR